ncbi:carbon storage regulator, CsrA [Pirellula staleyi DSM 6068]|uniref:Translational regulator CsrA n=1 Tax=Pirellula staleyi (strain ATCC 27377 / DSM 6068 / ICPB 4128) TaxID=530564 RepID=D2QZB6_PIRSD|nr:carbon storage regulator [Pirellula staleyi]ADB18308.1 carbon storage regulator, CsrA [Pirellula staleyi DSM 6068]
MLVLTRKLQQQIKIGDNIVLTILKVKGQTVRVGIEAPRDVHVVRSELPPEGAAGKSSETSESESTSGPIIAELTLTLSDDESESDTSSEDGSGKVGRTVQHAAATPRLPQRKAFNRYARPPIKVGSLPSSLAIAK